MFTRSKWFLLVLAILITVQGAFADIYISSPGTSVSSTTVQFSASATPTGTAAITSMQLYLDSALRYTTYNRTLNTALTLATGTHRVTFKSWDAAGKSQQRNYQISVGQTGSNPVISIQSPANGATVSSPVRIVASATPGAGETITGMVVYVDGVNQYTVNSASLDASITMANGTRAVAVKAWDAKGKSGLSQISLNVTQAATAPVVNSFSANPATVAPGQSSTLSWNVSNASSVTINPGGFTSTSASGTYTVTPSQTTTYTLTATNSGGSVTRTTTVTLNTATSAPTISSFTANPATVASGSSSTLSWGTSGATSITVNPGGFSSTSASGSVSVTPNATTTYTLTASNSGGQATRTTTVTVSSPTTGASLYVSPTGSDSNGCTSSAPCRQISRALQLVNPGTTILVADGQYSGFTVSALSGTASERITIRATGTNAQIMASSARSDTIYITYSDWIVIDGLRTFSAPRSGLRVDQSHNVTIRNGVFGNNTTWGIFTNHSNDLLIENNTTYGSVNQHGIYVSNSGDRPIIRNNHVYGNRMAGIHMNGDLSTGGGRGVAGDGVISGAIVERNNIHNNGAGGGAAINMDGVQDTIVRNNLIYANTAGGITLYAIDGGQGPRGMQIVNNTIDQASSGRWNVLISQTTGSIVLRNNILYQRNTARGGINLATSTDVSNTSSDYNVFGGSNYVATPNGDATLYTLAQWQAQGKDTHSLRAADTALWVNISAQDYHLAAGSPAIDRGTTVTVVTTDYQGVSRPQGVAYDIGAFEYR